MRRLLIVAGLFLTSAASAASSFSTYVNSRYGYSIAYPSRLLKALPESDSGDRRIFTAREGRAEFRVFAGGVVEGINDTAARIVKSEEESCSHHRATYKVTKPRLAVISCPAGPNLYYSKTLLRDGLATTMVATYPSEERSTWDPVVTKMARSLTAGCFPQ